MSLRLHIQGEYPADWPEIGDRVRAEADHRCIRCGHRYKTGEHGKGQWTPCDENCRHGGPIALVCYTTGVSHPIDFEFADAGDAARRCRAAGVSPPHAEWRILTVHHLDGDKSNCVWWNLLPLCQRCHLQVQTRVNPQTPYFLEHSDWFKPYVGGFYAKKYENTDLTREQVMARLDELLKYERLA
jgi:hypothetical protein